MADREESEGPLQPAAQTEEAQRPHEVEAGSGAAVTAVRHRGAERQRTPRQPNDDTAVLGSGTEPGGRATSRPSTTAPDHWRTPPTTRPRSRTLLGPGETLAERIRLPGIETPIALPSLPGERPFDKRAARRDGSYLLGEELGEGGMGRVIAAHDMDLGRTLAMKTLRDQHRDDETMIRALLFEARLTGQLEHPHIVPVHGIGMLADGRVFYTMKLVGDLSLRDVLAQLRDGNEFAVRTYTLTRLLQYFRGICMAMEYAHARGVIHRDLKPDNILIGEYGEVQIMDWGIARVLPRVPGESGYFAGAREEPGLIAGTPHYMSPEQARGDTHLVDARSDVYSLGVILYQILTYKLPFDTSGTEQQIEALLTRPAPRPRERAPGRDVPAELERICLGALERDRDRRYARAIDLWNDVESWLEGRKEEERLQELAAEQSVEAEASAQRYYALRRRLQALEDQVREDKLGAGYFDPLPERKAAWDRRLRVEHLKLVEARAFAEAVNRFHGALAYQRTHQDALHGLARLYRAKADDASRRGDDATMVLYGDLAREVSRRSGEESPATLDVRSYPEGATIRILELGDPSELEPPQVLEAGVAPCASVVLRPGSYLISGRLPGFRETRVPVVVAPSESRQLLVTLQPWSAAIPLVGHADELTTIKETFTKTVADGRLQSMLVVGDAGLGKGKLVVEFDRFLDELPELVTFTFVRLRALHRHVPFHAASQVLRHRFGIAPHDAPDVVAARVRAGVRSVLSPADDAASRDAADTVSALICTLPGLGGRESLGGAAHTREVFAAVTTLFRGLLAERPMVLTVRGADQLDRLSRNLLRHLANQLAETPLFCLAFARTTALPLNFKRILHLRPLDREGTRHQLSVLLKGPPASELLDVIHDKAAGNPFHIGELTRLLVTSGRAVWRDGQWVLAAPAEDAVAVETLGREDALLVNVRALPEAAARVLQLAAICGRGFWGAQIERLAGADVTAELQLLADQELLVPQPASRLPGHTEFVFRHNEVQTTLYQQTAPEERARAHTEAAAWLAEHAPEGLEHVAERAQHLSAAGRDADAAPLRAELAGVARTWEGDEAADWFE